MKKKKFWFIGLGLLVLVVVFVMFLSGSNGDGEDMLPKIKVVKDNIVDMALAVGTIEPKNEISIKSKISGLVSYIFAEPGTYVKFGDPLLEVRPDPTPLELAEAKRNVELAQVELDNTTKEKVRQESLLKSALISNREFDDFLQNFQQSELKLQIVKEKLALIESGKVNIGGKKIETVIKSSITACLSFPNV